MEKRRFERIRKSFFISYSVYKKDEKSPIVELTQIKDISLGGMNFSATEKFLPDTILVINLRTEAYSIDFNLFARVIVSKEIIKDKIYDTRVEFVDLDEETRKDLSDFLSLISKGSKKGGK